MKQDKRLFLGLALAVTFAWPTNARAGSDTPPASPRPPEASDLRGPKETGENISLVPDGIKAPAPFPFHLSDDLRLPPEDLAAKKEGLFLTGLPQIGSDPLTGIDFGIDGVLTNGGKRTDPLFAYTPYRWQLESQLEWSTRGTKNATIAFEAPYIGNSLWDLKIETGYTDDPTPLYFGVSQATMGALSYGGQTYSNYGAYSNALDAGGAHYYNGYRKKAGDLNVILEHSYLSGTVRVFGGLELNYVNIGTYDGTPYQGSAGGPTLLSQQAQHQGVLGVGTNFYTLFQAGVVYDTRDLAPDPSRGALIQVTSEYGPPVLGSPFNFEKLYFSAKGFVRLFPDVFKRLVLAGHVGFSTTSGSAPFYEYMGIWSSDNDVHGLGGRNTLRGYKLGRFVGPLMGFSNLELRYRFLETDLLKQHLSFTVAPFTDAGRVWDRISQVGLSNYRADYGIGLRMGWNVSTVIVADYAISGEDKQFFLEIGNAF